MRILYITAGAAGMYCGSCFRDNTLARGLMRRGHDVTLLPLYTPTLTDEPNVSHERVFFGGINVYLQQHVGLFRHTPAFVDRMLDAPALLRVASRRSVQADPKLLGDLTVSMLRGEHGRQRKELDKLIQWVRSEPAPDVVNLSYILLIGLAGALKAALGKPLCCALQGEDLFLEGLREPYRSDSLQLIREQTRHVDTFIAVNEFYRGFMSDYVGIAADRIRVAPLGVSTEGFGSLPAPRGDVFTVGFFARIAPEKGLHVLCDAYRMVRQRTPGIRMRLRAGGYLGPEHESYLADVRTRLHDWGLGDEFEYAGAPDRDGKLAFFKSVDVFSVPATYPEAKGLSVLEAMGNAIPVVQPREGAYPEMIERTGGGLLVPPNEPAALADRILDVWRDVALAERLGRAGAAGVRAHYSVDAMASSMEDIYQNLVERPHA